jgi:MerR family transcriptional regulator/heat shock protein HspR
VAGLRYRHFGFFLAHRRGNPRRLEEELMEWPDSAHAVYAISVAAELSGLHPQTLRIYEREGLVEPTRSSGGTRRYSSDDVERLRLIAALTTTGLNMAGVKRVLAMEEELATLRVTIERLDAELHHERKSNRVR